MMFVVYYHAEKMQPHQVALALLVWELLKVQYVVLER